MKKIMLLFVILFLGAGCMQEIKLVDPAGGSLPKERYYGSSITKPFSAVWYLSYSTTIVDRDKSEQLVPHYISMRQNHTFNRKEIKNVVLTIHVNNEKERYYELVENYSYTQKTVYKIGNDKRVDEMWRNTTYIGTETKTKKKVIAKSELPYRQISINLPMEDIVTCEYAVDLIDGDGELIFQIGKIRYSVTSY
jgi:hypothetical protein